MGKLRVGFLEDRDKTGADVASGGSLRSVMASFPTGVTVVGARGGQGELIGLTVNSFTSVSLDPPLILVCIARKAKSHDPLVQVASFTVSVLSASQAEIAERFATLPSEGRFDDVRWSEAPSGHPVVEGSAAWLDCSLRQVIPAGDHSILLAETHACGWGDEPALVFHRGVMASTDG